MSNQDNAVVDWRKHKLSTFSEQFYKELVEGEPSEAPFAIARLLQRVMDSEFDRGFKAGLSAGAEMAEQTNSLVAATNIRKLITMTGSEQ